MCASIDLASGVMHAYAHICKHMHVYAHICKHMQHQNLKHSSGKCVHPEGGSDTPDNGVKLVFYDGCDTNRNAFLFKPGLSFQAAASAVTSMIGVIVISLLWL